MNQFALLLLVVVGASAAPATAPATGSKTVLSMALDLLPDLQALMATAPAGPGADSDRVDSVSRAFTVFVPVVRKIMEEQAKQEKTDVDPKTLETLGLVERVVPGMIKLIGAASSGTSLGIDQEFALPDFTSLILGGAGPGTAAVVPNAVATDAAATYTAPQEPSNTAPQVSAQLGSESPVVNLQAPAAVVPPGATIQYALPGGGYFYSY